MTSTGDPDREANETPDRRLHLVPTSSFAACVVDGLTADRPTELSGDGCFRCGQPATEDVELIAAHPNQPARPPVALCDFHQARHASGAEAIGWCERGGHHGLSASYCDIHLGTIG
jgi:hypothetical protein